MSALTLTDASVELSTQDDSFLIDIPHLLLELTLDGKTVSSVNLYSRESSLGVWDADKTLVLPESSTNIMLSVIMQLDETERQLLASIGWNGAEMYSKPGRSYEIHLTRHGNFPNLVLKAHALVIENIQDSVSENRQESLDEDNMVKRILKDATKAFYDFENHGNLANLEQAIIQLQTIVERLSIEQANLSEVLDILGLCLLSRFERLGNLTDIQDSIVRHEMAIKLTPDNHDNRPVYFSNLGNSLGKRFDRLGRFADLDRAIVSKQTAVDLTAEDHPNRANYLINLGISLMTRFECFGNRTDMENAIALAREAVSFTPDSDSNKHIFLNTLGQCLNIRFVNTGNLADIEDAIASSQAAVDLAPDGHPDKPNYLNSLGNSLEVRFDRLGNLVDINKAVMTQQAAVDLTPKGHPNMPVFMNSLGTSLATRFMRLRHRVDLENAVTSLQEAVRLTPDDHPTRPGHLSNLAYALSFSFKGSQKPVDIDKSIELCQDAVDLTPEDHPDKHGYLNNLGCSLRARFDQLGDVADIERAIASYQKASDLIPDDHPARSGRLHNFGQALWARFGYFRQPQDVELAISHLTSAATSPNGSPIDRLVAAAEWYTIAATTDHPSLLSACECALSIMPLVAWPGIGVADRHRFLMEIGEITRDAVAAAISLEQYETALEWLEQGRSIVWTQILRLRTPVDNLYKIKPELAERLVQISRILNHGPDQTGISSGITCSTEQEGQRYRTLTAEWEATVERVRSLSGFETFLRPPKSHELMRAAQNGTVVVLNIAESRCDSLALLPELEEVVHIPLPNVTFKRVMELRSELKDLLYSNGIRLRAERAAKRVENESDEEGCRQILAELWRDLVKPVLDSLAYSPYPDTLPRIWWCITGPLAFLPIHAAGIYDSKHPDDQLSNYVISSYIPTLSALLKTPDSDQDSTFRLLSVIQPSAPGATSIPNTREELNCIRRHLLNQEHVVLEGPEGTKSRVVDEMKNCTWLHLACHGVQKHDEPTKSALILEDGHLTLEEIIRLDLPKAEFAFLSACQTTTGDEKLSEEAVHIAGGMLLAGYRGVVATMWSIQDDVAPEVADEFYAHIMRDGQRPDSRKAAEALHVSVQKLRKKRNIPLTAWIPFVHLGI